MAFSLRICNKSFFILSFTLASNYVYSANFGRAAIHIHDNRLADRNPEFLAPKIAGRVARLQGGLVRAAPPSEPPVGTTGVFFVTEK
ncbi:unnamed protein product [Colias eurytheme]|nr:unnamed protein product [Colias eurytheme]